MKYLFPLHCFDPKVGDFIGCRQKRKRKKPLVKFPTSLLSKYPSEIFCCVKP